MTDEQLSTATSLISRVKRWYLRRLYWRIGFTFIVLGTVLSLVTAILASVAPSVTRSIILALGVAALQIGGAIAFKNDGSEARVDKHFAQSTTARLLRLQENSAAAGRFAQDAFESTSITKYGLKVSMGILSARIDNITDKAVEALADWQWHPAALKAEAISDAPFRPDPNTPVPEGAEDDDD